MDSGSDVSSCGSGAGSPHADEQTVCRDFLRNVCRRGRRCKFPHLEDLGDCGTGGVPVQGKRPVELLTFCHDFQNGQCVRAMCRFVHCDRAEMELYRRTGVLPSHLLESALKRGADIRVGPYEVPVCKDFARGDCCRGVKCKYRHLSISDIERQLLASSSAAVVPSPAAADVRSRDAEPRAEPPEKRRLCDDYLRRGVVVRDYRQAPPPQQRDPHSIIDYRLIEDENRILQQRVQQLQKQVDDLTTTNVFLLDQNAQMRAGGKCSAVAPAAVSGVTNVTTVTVPAGTLAGPISQPVVATGGTTQLVAVPGGGVAAAVPVSLTHTGGSTAAIAVSLAPVSITQPGAAVSMSSIANQVTMAINQRSVGSLESLSGATIGSMGAAPETVVISHQQPQQAAQQRSAAAASIAPLGALAAGSLAAQPAVAASMGSINPLPASMGSMNALPASMGSMNPLPASMGSMNPLPASMGSMNPLPASMGSMTALSATMGSMNPLPASMASMSPLTASMAPISRLPASMSMASVDQATIASMSHPLAAGPINPLASLQAPPQQPVAVASIAPIGTVEAAAAAQVAGSGGPIVPYPIIPQLRPMRSANLAQ